MVIHALIRRETPWQHRPLDAGFNHAGNGIQYIEEVLFVQSRNFFVQICFYQDFQKCIQIRRICVFHLRLVNLTIGNT